MIFRMTEHVVKTDRHRTFYLARGAERAPLIVFVHGWPELSISWRHQIPCFADVGFRTVAPDMRGYGRSSGHSRHEDYALEPIVQDMIEPLDALLHGEYDYTCETVESRLAEPMRQACRNLTEVIIASGHWMAQEKPVAVEAALAKWLAAQLPELWAV